MKTILRLVLFTVIAGALGSCHKELEDSDANWKGEWHNRDSITVDGGVPVEIYLRIDGDNSELGLFCSLNCTECPCTAHATGKARINRKHNRISVGSGIQTSRKYFVDVDREPFLNANGIWECSVEGYVLLKDP